MFFKNRLASCVEPDLCYSDGFSQYRQLLDGNFKVQSKRNVGELVEVGNPAFTGLDNRIAEISGAEKALDAGKAVEL